MEALLVHGCVKESRWWLISIRPEKHILYTFISPVFLKEQAIYRLQIALEKTNQEEPNRKTTSMVKAIGEGKVDAELLRLDCCYPVSYFNDSRSYNSGGYERWLMSKENQPS